MNSKSLNKLLFTHFKNIIFSITKKIDLFVVYNYHFMFKLNIELNIDQEIQLLNYLY